MRLLTKDINNKYQLNPKLSEAKRNEINVTNKCTDCDNCYHDINGNGLCLLEPKRVNAFGCNDELLGNNAEPIPNYDYDDKDKYLDEFQQGGH